MSVSDIFLNIIIWILQNSILKLPESISILPITTIQSTLTNFVSDFTTAYNFIDNFIPVGLVFGMLSAIIVSELALHLGWKGIKYIINVFRGSGG
jgi:hypothetical protein